MSAEKDAEIAALKFEVEELNKSRVLLHESLDKVNKLIQEVARQRDLWKRSHEGNLELWQVREKQFVTVKEADLLDERDRLVAALERIKEGPTLPIHRDVRTVKQMAEYVASWSQQQAETALEQLSKERR